MTTVTIRPTASNHDARQATTTVTLTDANIALTSGNHWIGLYLPSVTVPQGATVTATLNYMAAGTDTTSDMAWLVQDSMTPAVFTTTASDISNRTTVAALSVTDAASGLSTSAYRQVDITTLIQNRISDGSWASGNAIVLVGDATPSSNLSVRVYDNGDINTYWFVTIDYADGQPMVARARLVPGMRRRHGHQGW